MSCLNVTTQYLNPKLNIKTNVIDDIIVNVQNITQQLHTTVTVYGNQLNVTCRVVCGKTLSYLDVQPNYIWLDNNMLSSMSFDIYSNVVWKID